MKIRLWDQVSLKALLTCLDLQQLWAVDTFYFGIEMNVQYTDLIATENIGRWNVIYSYEPLLHWMLFYFHYPNPYKM